MFIKKGPIFTVIYIYLKITNQNEYLLIKRRRREMRKSGSDCVDDDDERHVVLHLFPTKYDNNATNFFITRKMEKYFTLYIQNEIEKLFKQSKEKTKKRRRKKTTSRISIFV